jgi:hypothetical protein
MSQTYSIACVDCRKHLWVAQSSCGGPLRVYGGPEYLSALGAFLQEHTGHALKFGNNAEGDIAEMEEVGDS